MGATTGSGLNRVHLTTPSMDAWHAYWNRVAPLKAAKAMGSLNAQKVLVTCRRSTRSPSPRPGASHLTNRAAADAVQVIAGGHLICLPCPIFHSLMQGSSCPCTTKCG